MLTKVSSITLVLAFVLQCSAANAQERIKLRVSSATKTLGYGPLWIASRMGFFERQGLDVDLVVIRASDVGIQALAGSNPEGILISPGDRIAQLVFTRIARPEFKLVAAFAEAGGRQESGFGSTGIASACPNPAARRNC